jgi:hypothetical protein
MMYVLLSDHSPETCPTSNSKVREILLKVAPEMPNVAKRLGVNIVAGPLVSREHLVVTVAEAESAEAIDKFIVETGLEQWNRVRIIPAHTMQEGMQELSQMKAIF